MSEWVTHEQAAAIFGCHRSNVGKFIQRGELTSRKAANRKLPSLDRAQVEVVAVRRSQEREARASAPPRRYQRVDHRPDDVHEWLSTRQVAELLGVTKGAVVRRINPERLPAVENGGRIWCGEITWSRWRRHGWLVRPAARRRRHRCRYWSHVRTACVLLGRAAAG
jgi:hypothetical protein